MTRPRTLGTTILLAAVLATAAMALEVPFLGGRVNDLAGVLAAESEARLESRLRILEEETGAQVVILTLASLEGENLEDFSLRVAETWKLGREQFDDGALLLIARDDRKMRLEVGYGLEAVLTNATSNRILDEILQPRFRVGDFTAGIEEAVEVIGGLLRGEDALPPPSAAASMPLVPRLFGLLVFSIVVGVFSTISIFTRGFFGWFLYAFLMPFWLLFPMALLGRTIGLALFVSWVVGYPILRLLMQGSSWGKRWQKESSWGRAFQATAASGWSSSGGFSSGGGFSGGGGSFGGGGSSGSW